MLGHDAQARRVGCRSLRALRDPKGRRVSQSSQGRQVRTTYLVRFSEPSLHDASNGSDHPGLRTLLNTLGPLENFFPRISGVTPGSYHMFSRKHLDFEIYGWDVITYVRKQATDYMLICAELLL